MLFSFNRISLFDSKAHFSAPTRIAQALSRAGAVKVGRRSDFSSCTCAARPYLESPEHGSTLLVVGMTKSGGARLWRTNNRAATLYSVGRNDPDHDAVLRIGSEAPRRRAHSAQRHESHGFRGTPPPRTVIGDPARGADEPKSSGYWRRIIKSACSSRWAHGDPLRNHALAHQPPQRDQQLAGQCHNHGLAGFR